MKTKLILSTLFSFVFYLLSSQIPQGFNYQAIARNIAGEVIQEQPVKMMVHIQTGGGTVLWNEEHSLSTTKFGMVTFIIGDGPNISGIITDFSKIDWNAQTLYLKTQVQYPVGGSYSDMGTTQLWSVPYSLMAKDVEGPVSKFGVRSYETNNDSALFKVINKDGNIVFAVYNEGVRIHVSDDTKGKKGGFAVGSFGSDKSESQPYMMVTADSIRMYLDSNPLTKGKKGGFAVGGYDMSKDIAAQNYLDVSEDSVRIFIDNNPLTKGKKGGFAVGGYDMAKGTIENFFNVETDTMRKIVPAQNRILWYPQKNAFLTGRVLISSPDNVGINSFASGYEAMAKGDYSQAMGYQPVTNGNYATAIGFMPHAIGNDSYAFGSGAVSQGTGSFAFGSTGRDTTNLASTGFVTTSTGNFSFALGQGSRSGGIGSVALGINNYSAGDFSSTIGFQNTTGGSGKLAASLGSFNTATGAYSVAIGTGVTTSGKGSSALGIGITASGGDAIAIGSNSGGGGIHAGLDYTALTNASGISSMAIGHGVTAESYSSLVVGQQNALFPAASQTSWVWADPLFVIGNGNGGSFGNPNRGNAMVVLKNGNVGLGINAPIYKLDVYGDARFAEEIIVTGPSRFYSGVVYLMSNDAGLPTCLELGRASADADFGVAAAANQYCNNTNAGDVVLRTFNSGKKLFFSNGYLDPTMVLSYHAVGIGTSTPAYPLEVTIQGGSYTGSYGYLNPSGNTGVGSGTVQYSIKASGRIMCAEFNAASDARIKEIVGFPDGETNLSLINKLAVTDFRYIDKIGNGTSLKQGFIAQDVEKIIPDAVNSSSGYIPDIYDVAKNIVKDTDGNIKITVSKSLNIEAGDMVKLMLPSGETNRKVLVVNSSHSFTVEPLDGNPETVFVYGKEVNDFRSIDYDRIFTISVGAVQELSRENDMLRSEIKDLKDEIEQIKTMVAKRGKKH